VLPGERFIDEPASAAAPSPGEAESVTAEVALKVAGIDVQLTLTVPTAPVPPVAILPVLQRLSGAVEAEAVAAVGSSGRQITCRAGCGACCRQLVPISQIEARHLARLVEQSPAERRQRARARFAEAVRRLDEAGLLETLRHQERVTSAEKLPLGLAYFRLGIPCPFLEDESCSIYHERPLICREYLVTSPAAHCASPTAETIEMVHLPARFSGMLARFGASSPTPAGQWVPLVLALEWVDAHPDQTAPRPGPEWVAMLFQSLSGQQVPSPGEAVMGRPV
jgi:Fe-S-cluster containining protein